MADPYDKQLSIRFFFFPISKFPEDRYPGHLNWTKISDEQQDEVDLAKDGLHIPQYCNFLVGTYLTEI